MASITLTKNQEAGVKLAKEWFKSSRQTFSIVGYAGTGKSTLVDYLIGELKLDLKREVAFATFLGKASIVLTQKSKGKYSATTIHKLIYDMDPEVGFVLKPKEALSHVKLLVIDEYGMVDKKMEDDLLSFGVKVLALGDLGQLDPVSKVGRGTLLNNPDVELTEIMRQAEGNPIIHLSMLARQGKVPAPGKYGDAAYVLKKGELSQQQMLKAAMRADQILCGYNKTRNALNQAIRRELGFNSELPQVKDKLICTKNNWNQFISDCSLVNGLTGFLEEIEEEHVEKKGAIQRDCMKIKFRPDFTENKFKDIHLLHEPFTTSDKIQLNSDEYGLYDEFDFGYSITTHKSQGSQWENVFLINEVLKRDAHAKWLYTGITRAASRLILVV